MNLFIGLSTFLIGVWILFNLDEFIKNGFEKNLELTNERQTPIMEQWTKLKNPVESEYYVFGIRNPQEFLLGSKPIIEEHGPYVYKEYRTRQVLEWKEDTVVFNERTHFAFVESTSSKMSKKVFVVNYPLMSILFSIKVILDKLSVKFLSPVVENLLSGVFRATGENIIEQRTIFDILEGRKIDLIILLERFTQPLKDIGIPIPDLGEGSNKLRNQTYGFIWQRADIDVGPIENFRRNEHGHLFNHVYKVFGSTTNPGYKPQCNVISGSDGMYFGENLENKKNIPLELYNPNACRRLVFVFNETMNKNGINALRYNMDASMMDMTKKSNRCYCLRKSLMECDGWTEISPCTAGIPFGITMPHFLNSEKLQNQIKSGLNPDFNRHSSYLEIESKVGITLKANIAIQINLLLDPSLPGFKSIRRTLLPVLWTVQKGGPGPTDLALFSVLSFLLNHGNISISPIFFLISSYNLYRAFIKFKSHKLSPE